MLQNHGTWKGGRIMEWIKLEDQAPEDGQVVEFPADKERDGIINGWFKDDSFWSAYDGYHEPKIWRPYKDPPPDISFNCKIRYF